MAFKKVCTDNQLYNYISIFTTHSVIKIQSLVLCYMQEEDELTFTVTKLSLQTLFCMYWLNITRTRSLCL